VDINPNTFLIESKFIEKKINSRTKAIMPVHLFGNSVDMTVIKTIAQKFKLKIIEDCAQATCTEWDGQKVGSIGDIGCFSFFPTKNLGAAGDGGAVTTSDALLAQRIRELAVHGSPKRYSHNQIGYNSRLDTIQAAILNVKLNSISKWIKSRKEVANNYLNLIKENDFLFLPETNTKLASHTWNQFVIRFKNETFSSIDNPQYLFDTNIENYKSLRNFLKYHLTKRGINTIIYYPIPIHSQEAYQNTLYEREELLETEKICTEVLSLPMFPEITFKEQNYVVENLNSIINDYLNIN